jgi:hypothetical protein
MAGSGMDPNRKTRSSDVPTHWLLSMILKTY